MPPDAGVPGQEHSRILSGAAARTVDPGALSTTPPVDSRVITTADDLGLDSVVNAAIARGFDEGLITHSSLLVNLPGFEDACQLVRARGLGERIGLHLNFSQGQPLTEAIRRSSWCAGGRFVPPSRFGHYRWLSAADKAAAAAEARAQIAKARSEGLAIRHLDSHNDVHTAPWLSEVVRAIAREHGIERIRPARTCGPHRGRVRWLQFRIFNRRLRKWGLLAVDHLGSADDVLYLAASRAPGRAYLAEIVLHPRLTSDGRLVDAPSMRPIRELVDALAAHGLRVNGAL